MADIKDKKIIGLIEEISLVDAEGKKMTIPAKIDTGADSSSIDINLADKLALGPIVSTRSVVSSHGRSLRPVVSLDVTLAGKTLPEKFTLYNRSHMSYKVLIGRSLLRRGFLIDPSIQRDMK